MSLIVGRLPRAEPSAAEPVSVAARGGAFSRCHQITRIRSPPVLAAPVAQRHTARVAWIRRTPGIGSELAFDTGYHRQSDGFPTAGDRDPDPSLRAAFDRQRSAMPRPDVTLPDYDRRKLDIGIVHFGPGAFHRAHQAFYIDRLLRGDRRWGICDVALRGTSITDALTAQDGLYTTRGTRRAAALSRRRRGARGNRSADLSAGRAGAADIACRARRHHDGDGERLLPDARRRPRHRARRDRP